MEKVLPLMEFLMKDQFGNYLAQKVFEKASEEELLALVDHISIKIVEISKNLHGTRSI